MSDIESFNNNYSSYLKSGDKNKTLIYQQSIHQHSSSRQRNMNDMSYNDSIHILQPNKSILHNSTNSFVNQQEYLMNSDQKSINESLKQIKQQQRDSMRQNKNENYLFLEQNPSSQEFRSLETGELSKRHSNQDEYERNSNTLKMLQALDYQTESMKRQEFVSLNNQDIYNNDDQQPSQNNFELNSKGNNQICHPILQSNHIPLSPNSTYSQQTDSNKYSQNPQQIPQNNEYQNIQQNMNQSSHFRSTSHNQNRSESQSSSNRGTLMMTSHFNNINQFGQEMPISFDENQQEYYAMDSGYQDQRNMSQRDRIMNASRDSQSIKSRERSDSPQGIQHYENLSALQSLESRERHQNFNNRPSDLDQVIQTNHSKRTSNILSSFLGSNSLNYSHLLNQNALQEQQQPISELISYRNNTDADENKRESNYQYTQGNFTLEPVIEVNNGQSETSSNQSHQNSIINSKNNRLLQIDEEINKYKPQKFEDKYGSFGTNNLFDDTSQQMKSSDQQSNRLLYESDLHPKPLKQSQQTLGYPPLQSKFSQNMIMSQKTFEYQRQNYLTQEDSKQQSMNNIKFNDKLGGTFESTDNPNEMMNSYNIRKLGSGRVNGASDTLTTSSLGLGGSQDFQFKSRLMENELHDLRAKINMLENKLNYQSNQSTNNVKSTKDIIIDNKIQPSNIDYYASKFHVNTQLQSIDECKQNQNKIKSQVDHIIPTQQVKSFDNRFEYRTFDQQNSSKNHSAILTNEDQSPQTQDQQSQKLIELNKVPQDLDEETQQDNQSQENSELTEQTVRRNLMTKLTQKQNSQNYILDQSDDQDQKSLVQETKNQLEDLDNQDQDDRPLKIEDIYNQKSKKQTTFKNKQSKLSKPQKKQIKSILRNKTISLRRRDFSQNQNKGSNDNSDNDEIVKTNRSQSQKSRQQKLQKNGKSNDKFNDSAVHETRIKPITMNSNRDIQKLNIKDEKRKNSKIYQELRTINNDNELNTLQTKSIKENLQSFRRKSKSRSQFESKSFHDIRSLNQNNKALKLDKLSRSKSRQKSKTPRHSKKTTKLKQDLKVEKALKSHRQSNADIDSHFDKYHNNKRPYKKKLQDCPYQTESTLTNNFQTISQLRNEPLTDSTKPYYTKKQKSHYDKENNPLLQKSISQSNEVFNYDKDHILMQKINNLESKVAKLKTKLKQKDAFIEEILEENEELIEQLAQSEKVLKKQKKQIENQEKLIQVITNGGGGITSRKNENKNQFDSYGISNESSRENKIINIKKKK